MSVVGEQLAPDDLGSSTGFDEPQIRPDSVGTAALAPATAAANLLRRRCLKAPMPPETLDDSLISTSKAERVIPSKEPAISALDLVRTEPIPLDIRGQKHLIKLYVEREAQPLSAGLRQAAHRLARLCAWRHAVQLFGFRLDEMVAKVHIFVAQSERIAFNRGGRVFFNAHYYAKLNHNAHSDHALSYWFVTICHELAQNVSEEHDKEHEEAAEALLIEYIARLPPVVDGL
jgi:D-serine deaminase-like pyridoxal phosphate-dependent protein